VARLATRLDLVGRGEVRSQLHVHPRKTARGYQLTGAMNAILAGQRIMMI